MMSSSDDAAVAFDEITKSYGSHRALDRLSLSIPRGQRVCLLGPNGAGKSTAIRLMLGLSRPDSGRLFVLGGRPETKEIRRRLGCTPQDTDFPEHLRVQEVLNVVRAHYPRADSRDLLEIFGLGPYRQKKSFELSGGQKRSLALACAFASGAELLFFDEPTVALDVEARSRFWEEVRGVSTRGTTVIFTTHYLAEAEDHADRVCVIHKGCLRREGSPHEIRGGLGLKRLRFRCEVNALEWAGRPLKADPGGWYNFLSESAEEDLRELLSRYSLRDLEVETVSLEEAFLKMVGEA